jgi:hypothetical protein
VWTLGFRDASFSVACEYFSGESNGSVSLTVHRRFDSITDGTSPLRLSRLTPRFSGWCCCGTPIRRVSAGLLGATIPPSDYRSASQTTIPPSDYRSASQSDHLSAPLTLHPPHSPSESSLHLCSLSHTHGSHHPRLSFPPPSTPSFGFCCDAVVVRARR